MPETVGTQYTRIVTAQKLDDRFITAQILTPEDESKRDMGELFVLIEITRPWFPISQIGSSIIAAFKKSYFNGNSTSDLVNFEAAIKTVNDLLLKVTEQGDTEWIGHLNAIMMAVIGKEIHLTSTGNTDAFLFREGKVSYITQREHEADQNPAKTFKTVISGTLLSLDSVILGNPQLLDVFDINQLNSLIDDKPPYEAGLDMVKILKKRKQKTVNAIIIRLAPKSLLAEAPDTLYLDQPLEGFGEKFKRWWGKSGKPMAQRIGRGSQATAVHIGKMTKEKIIPGATGAMKKISSQTSSTLKQTWSKAHPVIKEKSSLLTGKIDNTISGLKNKREENFEPDNTDPSMSIIGKSIYTIHDYQFAYQKQKKTPLNSVLNFVKHWVIFSRLWLKQTLSLLSERKRRPLLIIIAAGILIIALIFSITVRARNRISTQTSTTQNTALQDAQKKLADGKKALTFNNKKEAQLLLGQAIAQAETLVNTQLAGEANAVLKDAQTNYDQLTGATRYTTLSPVVTAGAQTQIAVIGDKGYLVAADGTISSTGLTAGSSTQKITVLPGKETIVTTSVTGNQTLLIATKNQFIYEFKPGDASVSKLVPADGDKFSPTQSMALFGQAIYLLDKNNSQIWKYNRTTKGIDAATKYLPRGQINLSTAAGIAIDGSLYVLYGDGKVDKLIKGERQDFKISGIPEPFSTIKNPLSIVTEADSPSIFIVDAGEHRILEFDKNGLFSHQFILPADFTQITNVFIQAKARHAFVVNNDKLYQVDL